MILSGRADPPYAQNTQARRAPETPGKHPCSQRWFNFSFVFEFGQRLWKHEWSFISPFLRKNQSNHVTRMSYCLLLETEKQVESRGRDNVTVSQAHFVSAIRDGVNTDKCVSSIRSPPICPNSPPPYFFSISNFIFPPRVNPLGYSFKTKEIRQKMFTYFKNKKISSFWRNQICVWNYHELILYVTYFLLSAWGCKFAIIKFKPVYHIVI